jgi:hypothetical protein
VRNEAEKNWFRARLRSESRNETDDRLAEKVIFNSTIHHLDHFVAAEENRSINWVLRLRQSDWLWDAHGHSHHARSRYHFGGGD